MDVFRHFESLPKHARGCVVAIGNFDGVHLGHQKLLDEAKAIARGIQAPAAVLTFDPHPRVLMQPDHPPFGLAPLQAKVATLRQLGMSSCFITKFNRPLAETPAEAFVADWLVGRLGVRHVVVGENYRFGRKRMGDLGLLRSMGRRMGFGVSVASALRDDGGEVVSSSRIRSALLSGMPREAGRMLGRPWEIFAPATKRMGDIVAVSLAGYQSPVPGIYAVAAQADRDDEVGDAPVVIGHVVSGGHRGGNELLLPQSVLPSDFPMLRIRMLDLLERHAC